MASGNPRRSGPALLILLACTCGLWDAAAAVRSQASGPDCRGLPVPPAVLGVVLSTAPAPPASDFCAWLLGVRNQPCNVVTGLEWMLNRTEIGGVCNPAGQVPPAGSPKPLPDRRPLPPDKFNDSSVVLAAEGETYAWLYRVIRNLENFLPCALLAGEQSWLPPPGWELHSTLNLTQGGRALPLGVVLLERETGQVVVALRGTMTAWEWLRDFSYQQVGLAGDVFGGPVHAGFAEIFVQIWPEVQGALDELMLNSTLATQVTITGHSLGAGVSTLLAYAAQQYLDQQYHSRQLPKGGTPAVGAVLFAPPNVGPPGFVERANALVNARRLAYVYDIIPQALCAPSMPACSSASDEGLVGNLLKQVGAKPVPTTEPGNVSSWGYAQIGGDLSFGPSEMPQDAASWAALRDIQLCWGTRFLFATHVCSYSCFLSQFSSGAAAANNCWLAARPAGAQGDACPLWPATPGYPGMAAL